MKRLLLAMTTVALVMGLAAPAVLAANPPPAARGEVLIAINGNLTVAADERCRCGRRDQRHGHCPRAGSEPRRRERFGGPPGRHGPERVRDRRHPDARSGTTVTGDVRTVNATVSQDPSAVVGGSIRNADADLVGFAWAIIPLIILFVLGFALVTIVAGLALAGLGSRQVRSAEALIRNDLGMTIVFGLAGLVVIPIAAVLAMITVIGAPLGLAILFMVWPAAAFGGYLVAGIWIGEWLLYRHAASRPHRPYLAATVGLVVLQVAGFVPFVIPIASLVGSGALLLLAWRTLREPGPRAIPAPTLPQPTGI